MKKLFINANIVFEDKIQFGSLLVENNEIVAINPTNVEDCEFVDCEGNYLAPGFIDIHLHGGGGHDFMEATEECFEAVSKAHVCHGTTSYCPTSVAASKENMIKFLQAIENAKNNHIGDIRILGGHLEGPYFSKARRGAHDENELRNPSKEEYMDIINCSNVLRRWTIACELDGALELGQVCKKHNINASIGHCDAIEPQILDAIHSGYNSMTHLFNAMSGIKKMGAHRYSGCIEMGHLKDQVYCEVICDSHHVPLSLIELTYKAKGSDRMILVTDAIMASGAPDGEYYVGGEQSGVKAIKKGDIALVEDGSGFAGSVATTDLLIKTCLRSNISLVEAVKMVTITPARLIGEDKTIGSIEVGKLADLVIFDQNINVKSVYIDGNKIV